MKSLQESLLDNEDIVIKNTSIPKKPSVSKKDYFTYEQAWYNILVNDFKCDKKNNEKFIKFARCYFIWSSGWSLNIDYDDFDDKLFCDYIEDSNFNKIIEQTLPFLYKESKWEHEQNIKQIDTIIPTIRGQYQACDYFWGNNEGMLEDIYYNKVFNKAPQYSQYYNTIKKYLKFYNVI